MASDSRPSPQRRVPAWVAKTCRLALCALVGSLVASCASTGLKPGVYGRGFSYWLFTPSGAASYIGFYFPFTMVSPPFIRGEGKWRRDGNDIVVTGRFTLLPNRPHWRPWQHEERTIRLTIAENGDIIVPAGSRMDMSGRFVRDPHLSKLRRKYLWKKPDFRPPAD